MTSCCKTLYCNINMNCIVWFSTIQFYLYLWLIYVYCIARLPLCCRWLSDVPMLPVWLQHDGEDQLPPSPPASPEGLPRQSSQVCQVPFCDPAVTEAAWPLPAGSPGPSRVHPAAGSYLRPCLPAGTSRSSCGTLRLRRVRTHCWALLWQQPTSYASNWQAWIPFLCNRTTPTG